MIDPGKGHVRHPESLHHQGGIHGILCLAVHGLCAVEREFFRIALNQFFLIALVEGVDHGDAVQRDLLFLRGGLDLRRCAYEHGDADAFVGAYPCGVKDFFIGGFRERHALKRGLARA